MSKNFKAVYLLSLRSKWYNRPQQ